MARREFRLAMCGSVPTLNWNGGRISDEPGASRCRKKWWSWLRKEIVSGLARRIFGEIREDGTLGIVSGQTRKCETWVKPQFVLWKQLIWLTYLQGKVKKLGTLDKLLVFLREIVKSSLNPGFNFFIPKGISRKTLKCQKDLGSFGNWSGWVCKNCRFRS